MTRKVITPYFSHDANARNSDKLLAVRIKHGAEGYGIYFMILERLREESDYTSSTNYDVMAYDFRVDSDKIRSIVEDFDLFEFNEDGSRFYSPEFNERMEMKDKKKEKISRAATVAANKRWSKKNSNSSKNKSDKKDDDDNKDEDDASKVDKESEKIKKSCDDTDLSSNLCTKNNLVKNNDVKKEKKRKSCFKSKNENSGNEILCDKNEIECDKSSNSCDLNATACEPYANGMRFYAKQSKEKQSKEKQRKQKQTKSVINTFDFHPKVFDYTRNTELRDCLCVFFDERGKSKSIDPRFVEMFFKQLDSYSAGDDDKKILILRNSIINGWQNIYPVNLNNKSGLSKLDEYYGTEKRQTDDFTESELRDMLKIDSHL